MVKANVRHIIGRDIFVVVLVEFSAGVNIYYALCKGGPKQLSNVHSPMLYATVLHGTPLHIASEKVPLNSCLFLFPLYTAPAWQSQAIHLEESERM
jgi:hypothetical protein